MSVGHAAKLYCAGYAWCGAHLTDGLLTAADVAALARLLRLKNHEALAAEMVAAGLWVVAPGAHVVAEYLELNPTAAEVEARLQKAREKVRDWRSRQQVLPVTSEAGQVYPPAPQPTNH